ncbi:hypothetical protein EDD18DRAFT_1165888 [Armillaria luteobubalina]|uniref:Uncharacterized protein n=1 Tax=Armillaria luteobubalina TaxID=153913 RepID=A0AA39Q5B3_9AGAR|nr:hypothetical protein EDD18DRAFT_1165888 [Armillaria luteobubalina]
MELGPLPPGNNFTAGFLLSPWLIGLCADLYLQGVLSVQMLNYFSWYGKNDRATIQALLGSFAIVWVGLIKNFADIESARQHLFGAWYEAGNLLMVALISYRCYIGHKIVHFQPNLPYWIADVLLAATTAFFLVRTRRNIMPQTVGMINALMRLTFQTATPAVVCALLTLICVYLPPDKPRVANTFNQAPPKLYAINIHIFYYSDLISRTESRRQRPTITGSYSIQVASCMEVLQISDVDMGTDATMRKVEIEDGDSYIRKE